PTTIFRLVITRAASTEFPATARFSRRIDSELKGARISGINVIIASDSPCANPSSPCPVSGGTCYDDIRRNFSLEDPDSCVSSVSCVSCSPAWPTDKWRNRLHLPPLHHPPPERRQNKALPPLPIRPPK